MKKLKLIVPFLMAAIMTLAIPFTAACKKKKDEPVTTTLQSIEIDTTDVKTDYYIGENFDDNGLIVTATFKKSNEKESYTEDVTEATVIDSTAYKRNSIGTYTITVSYTFEDQTQNDSYDVTVSSASLRLDTTDVKTRYLTGEAVDRNGLKVYSNILRPGATTPEEKLITNASVSWNRIDLTKEGEYSVPVTARVGGSNITAYFTVSVITPRNGLDVQLAEGVEDVITLDAEHPTASIDPTQLVVKQSNEYGIVGETALSADKYDISVYNKQEEVTDYTALKGGVYQIWATLKENTDIAGFVLVKIVDNLEKIEMTSGSTEQIMGVDTISATWKFTATYVSGATKALTVADVKLDGFNTMTAVENAKATVTYTDVNALGTAVEKSVEVTYTVKSLSGATVTNEYDFSQLPVKDADYALSQTDFTGVNAFITLVSGGTANWRAPSNSVLEIKNDALQVTFKGTGTLTLQARSTSNGNISSIGVKAADGTKIAGTYDSERVVAGIEDSLYIYTVTGAYNEITFNITEPGTYTIYTVGSVKTATGDVATGRNTRLGVIKTVDNIPGEGPTTTKEPVVINISTLVNDDKVLEAITYTSEKVISPSVSLMAGPEDGGEKQDMAIDGNSKKAIVDGNEISFTHRLKLNGGTLANNNRSVKLTLSGACSIEVYAMSASSSDATRKLKMVNSAGTEVGTGDLAAVQTSGNTIEVRTINLTAEQVEASEGGVFYLGGTANINFYYIRIVYSAS